MSRLFLYALLPRTGVLGPFQRFAIWVQGCRQSCPGCMTPDARPLGGGAEVNTSDLADRILAEAAAAEQRPDGGLEGLTISGGEPFLQAAALTDLIRRVRAKRDFGVIIYTGYALADLQYPAAPEKDVLPSSGRMPEGVDREAARNLISLCDLIIDGPYRQERDDGRRLRGSANQQIHCLSDRYARIAPGLYGAAGRETEMHLQKQGAFLAGIPGPDVLAKWRKERLF